MKINYVIASYGKSSNRITKYDKFPHLKDVLKEHLLALLRLKHNLSKITIVKPKINFLNENERLFFDQYYNLKNILSKFNIDYQILNTENDGYSFGQRSNNTNICRTFRVAHCHKFGMILSCQKMEFHS